MNYAEACEATITRVEARAEIRKHNCWWDDFIADVGDRDEYLGSEILDWLGY